MFRYAVKRLLWLIPTLLGTVIVIFLLGELLPGDPVDVMLGPRASPAMKEALIHMYHLDEPLPFRLGHFFVNVVHGNLGTSIWDNKPVALLIGQNLPHTAILALISIGLAALIGIPLGALAAVQEGKVVDHLIVGFSITTTVFPPFVLGILLLLIFSIKLKLFPVMGAGTGGLDQIHHLFLPSLALSALWLGYIARLVRATMLEVLSSNFIKMERSFGVPLFYIWGKYALKNAVAPAISTLGLGLGKILGGAVFIEMVFSRPGLGRLLTNSVYSQNLPVIQGTVLITATMFVLANLIADLSYTVFDPRIRR